MEDTFRIRVVQDLAAREPSFSLDHVYFEVVYGPLVGPTAVVLARALGRALERAGGTTEADLRELARELGLQSAGDRGPGARSPLARALRRLEHIRVTRWKERGVLAVVAAAPSVSPRVLEGLPVAAQDLHFEYVATSSPSATRWSLPPGNLADLPTGPGSTRCGGS